jgi:hypothetical protein
VTTAWILPFVPVGRRREKNGEEVGRRRAWFRASTAGASRGCSAARSPATVAPPSHTAISDRSDVPL